MNQPVFWANRSGATHLEPLGGAGEYRGPVTAWFRAWLMGDTEAAEVFDDPCTLCASTRWTVRFR